MLWYMQIFIFAEKWKKSNIFNFRYMSRARSFTCPECGLSVTLTKNTARVRRKKSAARVRNGKRNFERGVIIRNPATGLFERGPAAGTKAGKRSRKGKEPAEGTSRGTKRSRGRWAEEKLRQRICFPITWVAQLQRAGLPLLLQQGSTLPSPAFQPRQEAPL